MIAFILFCLAIVFIRIAIRVTRFTFRLIFWLIDAALWIAFIAVMISLLL